MTAFQERGRGGSTLGTVRKKLMMTKAEAQAEAVKLVVVGAAAAAAVEAVEARAGGSGGLLPPATGVAAHVVGIASRPRRSTAGKRKEPGDAADEDDLQREAAPKQRAPSAGSLSSAKITLDTNATLHAIRDIAAVSIDDRVHCLFKGGEGNVYWYPARVISKSAAAGTVRIHYLLANGEDENGALAVENLLLIYVRVWKAPPAANLRGRPGPQVRESTGGSRTGQQKRVRISPSEPQGAAAEGGVEGHGEADVHDLDPPAVPHEGSHGAEG